jgi:hypothetical protein
LQEWLSWRLRSEGAGGGRLPAAAVGLAVVGLAVVDRAVPAVARKDQFRSRMDLILRNCSRARVTRFLSGTRATARLIIFRSLFHLGAGAQHCELNPGL